MKKYLPLVAVLLLASTAAQAYTSPYSYRPRNTPVEVDMSALDEIGQHPAPAEAAPSMRQTSSSIINDQPAALTPAGTPAPAGSTTDFLDRIMSYHTAGDVKKKPVEPVTPPPAPKAKPVFVPVAKPLAPAPAPVSAAPEPLVAPKADIQPVPAPVPAAAPQPEPAMPAAQPQVDMKPAAEPAAPAAETAPKVEEKPKAEEAKPEEKSSAAEAPATPVTRNNRKSPPVTQAADMTVSFATSIGNLSPEQEASLDGLAAKLKAAPGQRLQLRAFATDAGNDASNARRLSLSRGLAVRAYLIEKGVDPTAIDVRALGFNTEKPSDAVEVVLVK